MRKALKSNISVRVDTDVKQYLDLVLARNGMSIAEAIRLYLWQIVTQNGIPFKGFVSDNLPVKKAAATPEELETRTRLNGLRDKLSSHLLAEAETELKEIIGEEEEKEENDGYDYDENEEDENDDRPQAEKDFFNNFIERKIQQGLAEKEAAALAKEPEPNV